LRFVIATFKKPPIKAISKTNRNMKDKYKPKTTAESRRIEKKI
jgi:hypothetical protein